MQARAAGDDEAAIRRGLELRRAGKDQEALQEFQRVCDRNRNARCLAQMGLAEQALGQWVDAETHLRQSLSYDGDPWIRRTSPVLKSALQEIERHIGSLDIIGPQAAEVRVNGQFVGVLPFPKPVHVPIGTLNIALRKAGYLPSTRPVSIAPGALTRESIALQGIEGAPQPGGSTLALDAPASSPPTEHEHEHEQGDDGDSTPEPSGGRTWQSGAGWAAAGVAVLGVAGGGAALLLRSRRIDDANNLMCNVGNGTVNPVDPRNADQCRSLANSASRFGVGAAVAFSLAGLFALGSGVLFATTPKPAAAATTATAAATVACAPAVTTPGAFCQLRF